MDGQHLTHPFNQETESNTELCVAETAPTQPVPPPCQLEGVELVHVTGDQQAVYCLTQRQLEELIRAEQEVMGPLERLEQALARQDPEITQIKSEVWKELKTLGVLPSSQHLTGAALADLEARAQQVAERYQRARKSYAVSRKNIHELRRILTNGLLAPETYRFYTLHRVELEQEHQELEANLKSLEVEHQGLQKLVKEERKRVKELWAAVEAEVDYRVARSQSGRFSSEELRHKQYVAVMFAEETGLAHYVGEQELEEWANIKLRLEQINWERSQLWGALVGSYALILLYGRRYHGIERSPKLDVLRNRERERFAELQQARTKLQEERDNLEQRWQAARESFRMRVPAEDMFYTGDAMPRNQLIEIKRSGTGGFRYLRRDVLEEFRRQWAQIDMAKVKAALRPMGLKGAAKRIGEELSQGSPMKLRFAHWQSKEDHFLNLMSIELFKIDLNGETHPAYENFSIGAEAQMFRFAANAEVYGRPIHTATGRGMHLGAKVEASYSILEARATANLHLPKAGGWPLRLSYMKQGQAYELHLGYLRTEAQYSIQGFAGASLMLAAEVHVETSERQVTLQGSVQGEFFVGGTLKNELSLAVQWSKPEHALVDQSRVEPPPSRDFKDLVKVSAQVAVSFGVGFKPDFTIGLVRGKLVVSLKAHLVLGPGAGGGVAVELNVDQIIELIKFVRLALEQSDFRFLEWISQEAFQYVSLVMRLVIARREVISELVIKTLSDLADEWDDYLSRQGQVKDLARNVLNSSNIGYSTPETKASLLCVLTEKFLWSMSFSITKPATWFDEDEEQAAACMKILDSVISRRELVEILYRMKSSGVGKGSVLDFFSSYQALFESLLFKSRQKERALAFLERMNANGKPDIEE